MVVLSGYPSPAYEEALHDWLRIDCAARADGAAARVEVLWLNPRAAAGMAQGRLFDAEPRSGHIAAAPAVREASL